CIQGLEFPHSF
nr:immunoglobulin light chain junction region [Macaca mulatta]